MEPIPLYTSSWTIIGRRHRAGVRGLVPVRTSLGRPRWLPERDQVPFVSELAPYGLLGLPWQEFKRLYIARLERIGVERIEKRLAEVHAEYRLPLAVACFEDVRAGQRCHRRLWDRWHEEQTGQEVPEPPARASVDIAVPLLVVVLVGDLDLGQDLIHERGERPLASPRQAGSRRGPVPTGRERPRLCAGRPPDDRRRAPFSRPR